MAVMIDRTCEQCGTAFEISASKVVAGRGRFCSRSCLARSKTGDRNWKWKGGPVDRNCEICSRLFRTWPVHVAAGRGRFCSVVCANVAKIKPRDGVGTLPDRFSRNVTKSDGCWEWKGHCDKSGYGRLSGADWTEGSKLAHRLSWELQHGGHPCMRGSLSNHIAVCHRCDNPPCVRPDHLLLGTLADNNRDMAAKGRHWAHKATRCLNGHQKAGPGKCLVCRRRKGREWARRNRAHKGMPAA